MSDDYHGSDDEYWEDAYYFENFYKENDPNAGSGYSGPRVGGGFWIWLIVFIIASNISSSFGSFVLAVGIIIWILRKIFNKGGKL